MHEVGLVAAAIAQAVEVARQAGARRVERLTFAIAIGSHVSPEAVKTLVAALGRGTLVDGAAVEVVEVPAAGAGRAELALTSIEVDVAEYDGSLGCAGLPPRG